MTNLALLAIAACLLKVAEWLLTDPDVFNSKGICNAVRRT